ncbi:MAG: hypothetical protein HXX17_08075 [Geobacteraceae bacterium]|nr:hypothetical protein [Geobacteraceae bacterium]
MNPHGGVKKLRVCNCCGESKKTSDYSWNQHRRDYIKNCKECGQWLFLLRKVFGPTRDWSKNRANQRQRENEKRIVARHSATTPLAETLRTTWR